MFKRRNRHRHEGARAAVISNTETKTSVLYAFNIGESVNVNPNGRVRFKTITTGGHPSGWESWGSEGEMGASFNGYAIFSFYVSGIPATVGDSITFALFVSNVIVPGSTFTTASNQRTGTLEVRANGVFYVLSGEPIEIRNIGTSAVMLLNQNPIAVSANLILEQLQ